MKKLCPICGNGFTPEAKYFYLCDECSDTRNGRVDGSEEMKGMSRAFGLLYNHKWTEEDLKWAADGAAFPWLAEKILPLIEARQLSNLLIKVMNRI